jgi:hypothetical protein
MGGLNNASLPNHMRLVCCSAGPLFMAEGEGVMIKNIKFVDCPNASAAAQSYDLVQHWISEENPEVRGSCVFVFQNGLSISAYRTKTGVTVRFFRPK